MNFRVMFREFSSLSTRESSRESCFVTSLRFACFISLYTKVKVLRLISMRASRPHFLCLLRHLFRFINDGSLFPSLSSRVSWRCVRRDTVVTGRGENNNNDLTASALCLLLLTCVCCCCCCGCVCVCNPIQSRRKGNPSSYIVVLERLEGVQYHLSSYQRREKKRRSSKA